MAIVSAPPDAASALPTEAGSDPTLDRIKIRSWTPPDLIEVAGAALSSLALVWLIYEQLTPLSGTIGFFVCWYAAFLVTYWVLVRQRHGRMAARDRFAASVVTSIGLVLMTTLLVIVGYTIAKGLPALRATFFTKDLRYTGPLAKATAGGGKAAIIGTLEQVGIATLVSVPLGLASALFLSEVGGRLARPVRIFTDAMSGIPSILAGLFIYAVLIIGLGVPQSGFAGALALSVLMLPTVTRTCEVVLRLVPGGLREAGLALGGTEWRMVRRVVLPTARAGLVTASILGIARVVGETAPLLLTVGRSNFVNWKAFKGPQDSLPQLIYFLIRLPIKNEIQRAWTASLVLISIVLILFVAARLIGGKGPGQMGRLRRRRLAKKGLL
jgi:phosphate transport system permease protein